MHQRLTGTPARRATFWVPPMAKAWMLRRVRVSVSPSTSSTSSTWRTAVMPRASKTECLVMPALPSCKETGSYRQNAS